MLYTEIYKRHNYLNKDITLINNSVIIEYDMKNAGLEILFHNNMINKNDYKILMSLDKLEKNIAVGKILMKDKFMNDFLMNEFIKIRKEFFDLNNIKEEDVLAIKKDAIILINRFPTNLIINNYYEFRNKGTYKSYININGKEHYLSSDGNNLIVKGYSSETKEYQRNYLFDFLKKCLRFKVLTDSDQLFEYLINFKNEFLTFKLEKEYYKDIIYNEYIIELFNILYQINDIEDTKEMKEKLNINNNLSFIIEVINKLL